MVHLKRYYIAFSVAAVTGEETTTSRQIDIPTPSNEAIKDIGVVE
jgi:hypothetical protein